MTIDIPAMKRLWQQAFGDEMAVIDGFFATGFDKTRCQCLYEDSLLAAALYWFDCLWQGQKVAYIYAVATEKGFRGKGLCRRLMEKTHIHLQKQGYVGAVLVPGSPALFAMYEKFGYRGFFPGTVTQVTAGKKDIALRKLSLTEYLTQRLQYIPENSVVAGKEAFSYLATYGAFYEGAQGIFCFARQKDTIYFQEYLADLKHLPDVVKTLEAETGVLRLSGAGEKQAMYRSFTDNTALPSYFAPALD
ncbi:MAG: GNAT family N-acetyltransferase [Oscillospiraceae bacterium]|nr:GNAT family N-acetyltransferase [Oscillospiraceae bacterium]